MAPSDNEFTSEQLEASGEAAVSAAQKAGGRAEALVSEWVRTGNAAALAAVAEQGQGAARKAARRGVNVLKSRGANVPSSRRTGRIAVAGTSEAARQAWLLAPDGGGTQAIVLAERQGSGSYQACFVYFRADQNLLRIQNANVGLSRVREIMQQSLSGAGYVPVSVPFAWAQRRVAERRAWHAARGVPEPLGMMAAEKLLAGAPTEALPHPFDEEGLALGDEDAARLARDSGALHQWPEFRGWLPAERAVQELLFRVGAELGPEPATDKETVDPIVRRQVAAATDRYFTPERRAVLANRMKDSGLSVLARLGEHAALQVAAVIHVIQGAGLITNPPSDVRFLTAFFDKAIALIAARQGGQLRVPIPRATAPQSAEGAAVDEPALDGDTSDPLGPEVASAAPEAPPAEAAPAQP